MELEKWKKREYTICVEVQKMNHKNAWRICIATFCIALLFTLPGVGGAESGGFDRLPAWEALPVVLQDCQTEGAGGSYVRYPVLYTEDPAFQAGVEKINQAIQEGASVPAYLQLLSTVTEGSAGLRMDYEIGALHGTGGGTGLSLGSPYLSILFSAEGKMLRGRPSQVYYPMTFDLRTGDSVSFDQLFTDPEAAKEQIETLLETDVEPTLSTYLENSQLFPVPFDRFFLDGFGHLVIVYENSQLSFLSGYSGSVSFRYSELVPPLAFTNEEIQGYFDPMLTLDPAERRSAAWQMAYSLPVAAGRAISLGDELEKTLTDFRSTTDSGWYPGGAYYEVEDANYRGALILTDETEQTVTGLLTGRADLMDIQTGRTTLTEAEAFLNREPTLRMEMDEALAELYQVCPGAASIYRLEPVDGRNAALTLYADRDGVVQYIKLALE